MTAKPQVALLPTLRVMAGTSMRLYAQNLFTALDQQGEVAVQVAEPPCGGGNHAGPWRSRWLRYVRYPQWCQRVRADLYHITDHANAQLLLVLPSGRTAVTCHDLYPVAVVWGALRYPGSDTPAVLLASALRLQLLRGASAVICISQHTFAECNRFLGIDRRRMFLAHYGVDDQFRIAPSPGCLAEFRRKYSLDEDTLHVLHVGSTDPRKNLSGVLRVLARVQSRLARRVRLVRIGPAFPPALQREARALGLTEKILHLGELETQEIALAYRACNVLLYPSYHEGFCRPVAEAQASGLPVVTSDRGAIPELVEDPRLRFAPDDIEGMARCVCLLAESTEFATEVAERGQQAMRRFTWAAHAEAVVEAYRFLLSPPK